MKLKYRFLSILLTFSMLISLSGNAFPGGGIPFVSEAFASEGVEAGAATAGASFASGKTVGSATTADSVKALTGQPATGIEEEEGRVIEEAADPDGETIDSEMKNAGTDDMDGDSGQEEDGGESDSADQGTSNDKDAADDASSRKESDEEDADSVWKDADEESGSSGKDDSADSDASGEENDSADFDSSEKDGSEDSDASSEEQDVYGGSDKNDSANEEDAEAEDQDAADASTAQEDASAENAASEETAGDNASEDADAASEAADLTADVFFQDITVQVEELVLYNRKGKPLGTTKRVNAFWEWLFARTPLTAFDRDPENYVLEPEDIIVTVSGNFPEGVTAHAGAIVFAEEAVYSETALFSLDLDMYDAQGQPFVPDGEITVALGGRLIKGAVKKDMPLLVYDYAENPKRAEKLDEYAADVLVYRDAFGSDERLRFETGRKKDSVIFTESVNPLNVYTDNTVDFVTDTLPAHMIVSSQVTERTLRAKTDDGKTKVSVHGAIAKGATAEAEAVRVQAGGSETKEGSSDNDHDGKRTGTSTAESVPSDPVMEAAGSAGDVVEKAIGPDASGLLAVEITLNSGEEDPVSGDDVFVPDLPVNVTITDAAIREALAADGELSLWQIPAEGVPVLIEDADFHDSSVEFVSEGALSYAIFQTCLEKILEATDGKAYRISVSYDQAAGIPADAELVVEEIRAGDAGYEEYIAKSADALGTKPEKLTLARAFDITLKDPETGEEYQPDRDVKVSIELLNEDLGRYTSIDVVHILDDGKKQAEVMDSTLRGESVAFETDGFSIYVLTGSNGETDTPQCTYTFWIPNADVPGTYIELSFTDSQGRQIFNQTVISGEELIVPQVTSTDEKSFAGWYEGHTIGGTLKLEEDPYDFDNIKITENSAIDLYAVYHNYASVIFHDKYDSGSESFPVAYTRRAELVTTGEGAGAVTNASVKIDNLSIANTSVDGRNMAFYGWSETPVTTPGAAVDDNGDNVEAVPTDEDGCITVTGDTHLYPIFTETCLLTFYAAETGHGAAYNGPRYLKKGDSLGSLPITSMSGYTFTGWYTGTMGAGNTVNYGSIISNADGTLIVGADDAGVYVYEGRLYLRADTTLYAKWADNTSAEYRILYWKQDGTGSDYIYEESVSHTGTIGESVSVSEDDKANDRYPGFHLKEEPASAEVSADGSTELHVYYDHDDGYEPGQGNYTLTFKDSVNEEDKISPDLRPDQHKSVEAGTVLAGQVIKDPVSGRKGYIFSKWFLDPYCTQEANLDTLTMPDQHLTLYAGWEAEWYVVSIDPNYGELTPLNDKGVPEGTGSTWFWQTIEREPVAEYTYVERNYVASSSGTFYYVSHPGDGEGGTVWPDRCTYYTTDISKATEDTTFEYSPGVYTYVGWYEVLDDGTEVPFVFGERTDHNTTLKLHWKKNGVYYLKYNAVVNGLTGTMDDADQSAELFADSQYADYAEITLTHSANAPRGYTFSGWKVRGSDSSKIYTPGQVFTLHADDAKRVSGRDVVYLDAVYTRVGTASIIYDANGGTIAESNVNFGMVTGSSQSEWEAASGTVDQTAGTATVSGLSNNSRFKLSDGSGFTAPAGSDAVFLGWSLQAVCDDSKTFYPKDSDVTYGVSDSTTLYAVWGVQVTYNLNSVDAEWGESWDSTVYTLNNGTYSMTANRGTVVTEPAEVPVYTGTDRKLFRYWATRSGAGTGADPYVFTEYDFSQPVTGALDLYACWTEENTVVVHAVDASQAELSDETGKDGWTVTNVIVSATETALNGTSHVTETPDNYEFAFAAVASELDSVSESSAVTAIKYENKKIRVRYKGETSFRVLGDGKELFFVYYQKKALAIGYKSMAASGVLDNVTTSGAPENTGETLLGEYSMSSQLTAPLSLAAGFTNYAFAIGTKDPGGDTQLNASNLSLITNVADADAPVPALRVRNTWRGFEYTTETGENAVWTSCGYAPQLYVIYYTQQPTVVMFDEKTVGTVAVMDTAFTFNLLVTQTATTTVSEQAQRLEGDNWVNDGNPFITTTSGTPEKIFDTRDEGNQPYILRNGEASSSILFYDLSKDVQTEDESGNTRIVTTTTTVTAQTVEITQTVNDSFTTAINGTVQETAPYQYTYTADGSDGTRNVTFTNTHKSLPVEVHVAMVENDGTNGGIIQRDSTFRSTTETAYKFDLALGADETLLTKLPSDRVFTGDTETYAFGAVMYGTGAEDSAIQVGGMGIASIAYEQINNNIYELVLKDGNGEKIAELGSDQLYYLYYPMAKIRYVKEAADGTLTDITGCLANPATGNIETSDSVTYSHQALTMNGMTVAQNESFEIPLSGFVISQSGNNFRMPPVLDDGLFERYLSYIKIGAGSGGAANSSALDVSAGLTMQLKVQDNTLQYSFDGAAWKDLPLSGTPTIYAIYTERGYDFEISKTVDMSKSGEDAIFSGSSFTVTIRSTGITKNRYDAEGADSSTVAATPAEGTTPGTITLTVVDGTKVRIKGLGRGDYTITESGNDNYTLTAKSGPIVGGSTGAMAVTDNTTVSLSLDAEKKVELTNSPKAICKIGDHYFYTLRSMVSYVDENIATKTATAEMLTDYVMPKADTVELPGDFNLTLTTADSVGHVAVITRTADLAEVPLFTSSGALTLTNLTLEGGSIEASAPMIRSGGDLTIGSGATIRNVVGGGAINATAGDITVSGTIQNCSAAEGGAIYHSGNSTITLNGTGTIQNNTATSGNGGAIYLAGGMVNVSGTSRITGNKAESGNGGAIFADGTVEIEIDQGGAITGNTAKEGGAIYANAASTINISETENVSVKPAVTGNTATTGSGGAIYVNGGSVSVSGGSVSSNKAENGQGGAICANTASVAISKTAKIKDNTAKEGGAVYAVSGQVTVSGGAVDNNTASTGSGGAIYAGSGNVTVSGGSLSGNASTAGSGGAVYAGSGNVTVSGGSMSDNTAKTDGGAVFAGSGSITVAVLEDETASTIRNNKAADGKGGALYADTGAVSITGATLAGNTAGSDGGAVYAASGAVTLTNSTFGGGAEGNGNTAGGSGGAIYADSGNVTVSGGSMQNNRSTAGNGGAVYAGSGAVDVSGYTADNVTFYTQFLGNNTAAGRGGAIFLDSGSLTLNTVTATGNSAINGAAVFTDTGRVSFSAGSCTGNTASEGGALGVGSKDARLVFNGDVQIRDNTLGTADDAQKSNVYLDQDDDAVINIDTLGSSASIGIYVADNVENTRGVPGARFAIYTSNDNVDKITNDRYTSLTVQSDTAAKKLFWGNGVRIEVMYRANYAGGLPNGTSAGRGTTTVNTIQSYYPTINREGEAALSELAADVYTRYSAVSNWFRNNNHPNATFGGAFYYNAPNYSYDISTLVWNKAAEKWQVRMRSGQTADLPGRIYLIYSEPAYISIENNTEEKLTISDLQMTVNGSPISVIHSDTSAGFGMVFAKNGAIRTALLPITASDLTLAAGQSVSLLIPGGQNMTYTLDGSFETTTGDEVRLRRGAETSLSEETVTVAADGSFNQLTGTTLNAAGTYNVIFGDDKIICKVVDANETEHPYSKISDAIADIVATTGTNPPYALTTAKTATIEMVTDYLLPASDAVVIPKGYDITITTAAKTGGTYNYTGEAEDGRATISRDSENTNSMITSQAGDANSALALRNLIIDGKSVRGNSAGGAVNISYFAVVVDKVDFINVYASNGGALYIDDHFNSNSAAVRANSMLTVSGCRFSNCNSTLQTGSRIGGGAIHFFGDQLNMTNCTFENCNGGDQAGAVFHRVDGNYNSWTTITGCTFTNCSAKAAGGMELDSKTITVMDCTFEHCVATQRNGGGFNAYMTNNANPGANTNCTITLTNCSFNDCQAYQQNGGGFRSTAVYTTVRNCTFSNTSGSFGGGIAMSNSNALKGEIYGCAFNRCTAIGQGGGVGAYAKELIIGDGYYYLDDESKSVTVVRQTDGTYKDLSGKLITDDAILDHIKVNHTEINSCTSSNEGGGVYHAKDTNGSSATITNATISGNRTTGSSKSGGGVYTNARTVAIAGSTITDNTCTNLGGGVYAYSYTSLTIKDSDISRNIASGNGGGVWFDANNDTNRAKQVLTIKGSSIDGNTSNNGSGGGVYTQAMTVSISASDTLNDTDGRPIHSSVSNNTAKTNGGGLYQSRNVDGSRLEISDTNVNGNTVTGGAGGGIYANVRKLTAASSGISRNTASGDGGGIWFDTNDTGRPGMELTIEGCTLDTNISGGNGGGVYTMAKTVEVKAHTEGTGAEAVTTGSTVSNCTAAKNGGGIYQDRDIIDSSLTISSAAIRNNTANDTGNNEHGGGGVYANVRNMTLTGSEVSGNTAAKHGGGIYKNSEGNDRYLIIDNSSITSNTAGNQGGGIYDRSQLTLRNGTTITGNRLTTNTAANCAGVYLVDNRTLYVGPEDASEGDSDTIVVRNNTTANNTLSDLRLWWNSGTSENNAQSVYVYCNLSNESEIRVVNAAKTGTQFGSAKFSLSNGFSDDNYVFIADNSTLHGITDRADSTNKKIIWAGPPVAKLTDGDGRLLYIKYYGETGTYPAIFDRLDTGASETGSTVSPFSLLRMDNLTLYYKDGTEYSGTDYCIKMLVEHYETSDDMTLPYVEGRKVTFTTAEKSFPGDWPYTDTDQDTYHFEGRAGGRATVIRGSAVPSNRSLMNVNGSMDLQNIIIDGGTENGVSAGGSTRCMYIDNVSCIVTLGENAVLQNGKVNGNGGGVNINNGTFNVEGGVIRNCTADNDGGGAYLNNGNVTLTAGSIYKCTANGSGGGVRISNGGTFTMSGGTIQGCSALGTGGGGGGVCVAGGRSMYMSGGSIINNSARNKGGGIMVFSNASRLYFSGRVNISGNTCEASAVPSKACNVELDQDSNGVINTTGNGLYPGTYIGVYVTGTGPDSNYDKHGVESTPFGNFKNQTSQNTSNFYSFVNDRNGLKGGIIEETDSNYVKTGEYAYRCIYWIQIFSLKVTNEVVSGASTTVDPDEIFLFKVNVRGDAEVTGQLNAAQIDSSTGDYGEMYFTSNGSDTTTAILGLVDGQTVTGVNLSEGLKYEVIEYLTVDQAKRYAAMPAGGSGSTTESLEYNGKTYQVVSVNSFASEIGENKERTDVDPYTSELTFSNLMPVCKITDMSGNILYRRYDWEKITNKTGEGPDGGNNENQPYYFAPAVLTELTGDDGAFKALEGTLYSSNGSNPTSYSVKNGVQVQMLIGDYKLNETVEADTGKVTLTTASAEDTLFPKQDAGNTSTVRRAFAGGSMFHVSADLTFAAIILDGAKESYTAAADGGIAGVAEGGHLTVQNGAVLQNSRTAENYKGGAVYTESGGTVTMTGGTVNHNESVGDGAGIYLSEGSTLKLSGAPGFGGTGTNVSGNITTANGNFKTGTMVAKLNGGKDYTLARQDIYIAGYAGTSDDDTSAGSLVVDGNITSGNGTIWVWAERSPRYRTLGQFARYTTGVTNTATTLAAFRNAQDDATTGADQVGEYLYGITKADDTGRNVFWHGLNGFSVKFKKIDGYGNALAGAVFSLYTDPTCSTALEVSGAAVTGMSDSTGVVIFDNKIPVGVYYMKETTIPAGYTNTDSGTGSNNNSNSNTDNDANTYIVLVGDQPLAKAEIDTTAARYLTDITAENIAAQTQLYKTAYQDTENDYDKYTVFLIDSSTGRAVTTPDIARYGIMNFSTAKRKAILKKIGDSDTPLDGAVFEILRYDGTKITGTDINGETTTFFTSGKNGVYFIDLLPFGTYYLHEITIPSGYKEITNGNDGNWFILTVNKDGAGYEQADETMIRRIAPESSSP